MAIDTIVGQGKFTADGNNKVLQIRSDVDKIVIENYTQWSGTTNGNGYKYTWQKGMGTNMLMEYHPAADHTSAVDVATSVIEVVDSSNYSLGSAVAITAGTNATQPVYSTGTTTGLKTGTIVRIYDTDHTNLNGIDFSIDSVVASTSFRWANALATAPGKVAGTGSYRIVAPNVDIYNIFYPGNRYIANITQASSAVVTTTVDHGYAVGQKVKFKIPAGYGMTELNGLTGNITAVSTSTFTVDVDTSAFTAFTFPTTASVPFDYAVVVPAGDAKSSVSQNSPAALYNQSFIGVILTGGATAPAGNNNDVIYWTAYKSDFVDNE